MKWIAPAAVYVAVAIGLFRFHHAFLALLGFHAAILLCLWIARPPLPARILFKSSDLHLVLLSLLLCGSSGFWLYLLWPQVAGRGDLPAVVQSYGLTAASWPAFAAYFILVNPPLEEYFWRGYLGSPARGLHLSDFLYSGFHGLILLGRAQSGAILYGLAVLVGAGWFWRQLTRAEAGLLAAVLGHMAADLSILLALYRLSLV